jgi:hypothetical protein
MAAPKPKTAKPSVDYRPSKPKNPMAPKVQPGAHVGLPVTGKSGGKT